LTPVIVFGRLAPACRHDEHRHAAQWASYIAFLASFCYAGMNLSIRPCLVADAVDPDFFPKERFRAALGGVLYAIAGGAGWLSIPKQGCSFSGIAYLCGITSEGWTWTQIRPQFGKARRVTGRKAVRSDCALNSASQKRDGSFTNWSR
jgi:hypothetical protein